MNNTEKFDSGIGDGWQLREHHMLATGAVLFALNFRAGDARPLEGLLRLPLSEFRTRRLALHQPPGATLADALLALISEGGETLEQLGAAHELQRRQAAYLLDRRSWDVDGDNGPTAKWRSKYMTKSQRHLIHAVCAAMRIAPPPNLTRGAAADWLEEQGAHHIYRNYMFGKEE